MYLLVIRLFLGWIFLWHLPVYATQPFLVKVPVANVVAQPTQDYAGKCAPMIVAKQVENLVTQVLFNEPIDVHEERGDWCCVSLPEQIVGGHCVTGWVRKKYITQALHRRVYNLVTVKHWEKLYSKPVANANVMVKLSMGTKFWGDKVSGGWWQVHTPAGALGFVKDSGVFHFSQDHVESAKELRAMLVAVALRMKGLPFCWYGRSSYDPHNKKRLTSVGCDGLIDLAYRCCGLQIPRFAADQYTDGSSIDGKYLKAGDLLFYAKRLSGRAHHAMLYLGQGKLIEGTFQSPKPYFPARVIGCSQRLSRPYEKVKDKEIFWGRYRVCFSTFLSDKKMITEMRKRACGIT